MALKSVIESDGYYVHVIIRLLSDFMLEVEPPWDIQNLLGQRASLKFKLKTNFLRFTY